MSSRSGVLQDRRHPAKINTTPKTATQLLSSTTLTKTSTNYQQELKHKQYRHTHELPHH